MRQRFAGLARLWFAGLLAITLSAVAAAQNSGTPSLYQRIGGYDVIAAITDDFLGRMRADARFSRFAGGRSLDSRTRARQLTVDMLCQLAGGPCVYIGRPMKAAHAGLAIADADWEGLIAHVAASLDQRKIPAKEKEEFLTLFSNMKKDIVEAGGN
jgi:hemoglobin